MSSSAGSDASTLPAAPARLARKAFRTGHSAGVSSSNHRFDAKLLTGCILALLVLLLALCWRVLFRPEAEPKIEDAPLLGLGATAPPVVERPLKDDAPTFRERLVQDGEDDREGLPLLDDDLERAQDHRDQRGEGLSFSAVEAPVQERLTGGNRPVCTRAPEPEVATKRRSHVPEGAFDLPVAPVAEVELETTVPIESLAAVMPSGIDNEIGLPKVHRAPPVAEVPKSRACCGPCRGKQ